MQNLEFVNLKCVAYTQPTPLPLRVATGCFVTHIGQSALLPCIQTSLSLKPYNRRRRVFCRISPVSNLSSYTFNSWEYPGGLYNGIYANMIAPEPKHPPEIRVP